MLRIYADYFMQLLAMSTAKDDFLVYGSICSVHKTWTICSYKNEQIDLEAFDLLSQSWLSTNMLVLTTCTL